MQTRHWLALAWLPLLAVLLIPTLALTACGGGDSSDAVHETPDATAGSDEGEDASDAIAPIRSQGNGTPPAAAGTPGPVRFDLPASWQEHPPASSMRTAQALIPGPGGVAEMVVFYFGPGGGGGTEANLERWIGQMQVAEGIEPERGSFEVGDLQVTHVTVHGILLPSNMGTGPTEPQPNSMLLGAVVEGPGGPWFFKVTGPAATLEGERDTFLDMLKTVQPPA
jgi:hypothetical protein